MIVQGQGLELLAARVKALRRAVRLDDFRLAAMALQGACRYAASPIRRRCRDGARLFEISGLWLRNIGDRHQTKRQSAWEVRARSSGSPMRQSLEQPAQVADRECNHPVRVLGRQGVIQGTGPPRHTLRQSLRSWKKAL